MALENVVLQAAQLGMPKVAIEKEAVSKVLSVEDIIRTLNIIHTAR